MFVKILKYGWVPLIISLVILYLCCFVTSDDVPDVSFDFFIPIDKVVHFIMYFGLSGATAFYYIYLKRGRIDISKLLLGAFLLPILYGGLIEILQWKFTTDRSGEWMDFLADALGSVAALPFAWWFREKMLNRK